MKSHPYELYISNLGLVVECSSLKQANEYFESYVELSKSGYGRASGESVTLILHDEIIREFQGCDPDGIFLCDEFDTEEN
jgi:hypothetical protein